MQIYKKKMILNKCLYITKNNFKWLKFTKICEIKSWCLSVFRDLRLSPIDWRHISIYVSGKTSNIFLAICIIYNYITAAFLTMGISSIWHFSNQIPSFIVMHVTFCVLTASLELVYVCWFMWCLYLFGCLTYSKDVRIWRQTSDSDF